MSSPAGSALSADVLALELQMHGAWNAPVSVVARTGSTNDDARRAAAAGAADGSVFAADVQDAGRGQRGHTWEAAAGSSLLFSCLFRPRIAPRALPPLSLVMGLAVAQVSSAWAPGEPIGIKWPNDVCCRGRKLAGVLVEAQIAGSEVASVVVGVGLNVIPAALSDEVRKRAISALEIGVHHPRERLLAELLWGLREAVSHYERDGLLAFLPELRARDAARGRRVTVDGAEGEACGIGDGGELLVRRGGVVRAVMSADILFEPLSD